MRVVERTFAVFLSLVLLGPALSAQQANVVDPSTLDQALAQSVQDTAAKRQTVLTALRQPQVKEVAQRLGLDPARAESAVSSLDGAVLDQLAAQAQQVNDAIAGGQTIRLNILWVILGLLVLILIIVAV
jgi:anti-anti-sigma regulatory factor